MPHGGVDAKLPSVLQLRQLRWNGLQELLHVLELLLLRVLQLLQLLQLMGHHLQDLEDLLNRRTGLLRLRNWTGAQSERPLRRKSKRYRLRSGIRDRRTKTKRASSHEASSLKTTNASVDVTESSSCH